MGYQALSVDVSIAAIKDPAGVQYLAVSTGKGKCFIRMDAFFCIAALQIP